MYVILDVYSRYVVGWMAAHHEAATLAERLLAQAITDQAITDGQLTVHADRGSSMTSKPVAMRLSDLGITRSHSRPHAPDDNPYSESQFKTLKHHPTFPDRFGSTQDARSFCQGFLLVQRRALSLRDRAADPRRRPRWPRHPDHHRPATVLSDAYAAHPERFVRKLPEPPRLPEAVWINKPVDPQEAPQQFPA